MCNLCRQFICWPCYIHTHSYIFVSQYTCLYLQCTNNIGTSIILQTVAFARQYYGCDDIQGVYLENQGGFGTAR